MDEVEFLRELLEIYSPSGQEAPLASYLVEKMAQLGFDVHIDDVGNVIGELQGARSKGAEGQRSRGEFSSAPPHPHTPTPLLLFLGHMDTVPGFISVRLVASARSGLELNPSGDWAASACERGGRLYGRGAVDAKGPLAAFILAAAKAAPSLEGTRIVIIGAVEEEASSRGARHIIGKFQPDYVIVGEPSGWDGITLGYKGSLFLDYRLSRPAKHNAAEGPSPPEEAVGFWNRLTAYVDEVNRGKRRRFESLDLSLQEINSSGDGFVQRVEMAIVVRMPLGFDVVAFKEKALDLADRAEVSFQDEEVPFRSGKNNPLVRAFLRAIRALGGKPRFKLKTGTSDMNVVGPVWNCPIVAYGPGDSSLDHTPDEYIEVEEYLRAIEVLTQVIADCKGQIAKSKLQIARGK